MFTNARRRLRRGVPLLAAALSFLAVAPAAHAAPVQGPAGDAFYTPPKPASSYAAGDMVWYRSTSVNLGPGAPATNNWTFLYRTTDSNGNPTFATGTILTPKAFSLLPRSILAYAFGTQGLAPKCAPSRQLVSGTEYEAPNLIAALNKGFAVVGSDYPGYTNGAVPSYTAGKSEGYAVLDAIRAAAQYSTSGISCRRAPSSGATRRAARRPRGRASCSRRTRRR